MKIVSLQLIFKIMIVFHSQKELKQHLSTLNSRNHTIGFVPTMGALHQGHLSLLEQSIKENEITVISIFVNPTQFNNAEDLQKYPRTLKEDVTKIQSISQNILVFAPSVEDIYQSDVNSETFDFDGLENQMEGKFRPGHFNGVGTIVKRLFEIIQPTRAYFGEKDFQQLQIIKKMVEKNQMPVQIIGCPIHRESNGLAMSSRNERLSSEERNHASIIYETLQNAKKLFGTNSVQKVTEYVENQFKSNPMFQLEYFQIADEETLEPCLEKQNGKSYRAFIAVFVNNIRLIDTISLN